MPTPILSRGLNKWYHVEVGEAAWRWEPASSFDRVVRPLGRARLWRITRGHVEGRIMGVPRRESFQLAKAILWLRHGKQGMEREEDQIVAGAKVGRFLILRKLGEGTFARVYLARDPRLSDDPTSQVALKIPRTHLFREAQVQLRLLRELQIVSRMPTHPGVCRFIETGMFSGTLFFVYEYISGETLHDWLARHPQRSLKAMLKLAADLARIMSHVHDQQVIHRDLKPSNVMLRSSTPYLDSGRLEPVILDFGLARGDRQRELALTVTGQRLGTPAYFSPEVARGETVRAENATDIYSLGAILYELLLGRPPFSGHGFQLIERIEQEPVVPPSHLDPRLDPAIDACCLQSLAKNPADRFAQSMHHFGDELERLTTLVAQPDLLVPAANLSDPGELGWTKSTSDFRRNETP